MKVRHYKTRRNSYNSSELQQRQTRRSSYFLGYDFKQRRGRVECINPNAVSTQEKVYYRGVDIQSSESSSQDIVI